ncbi:MAG: site-specific integrase [Pseudomonadota bacterium]|nr:site-specific integrase [Pseudomonadota bacterium]
MTTIFTGDGYQLFTRPNNPNINVRFSISGQGQRRVSLKTADIEVAKTLAFAELHKCRALAEAGLVVTNKKFEDIAEEYIAGLHRAVERGDKPDYQVKGYPGVIRRFFIQYFGKRLMSAITSADIERFWEWRREYWITGPGSKDPTIVYYRKKPVGPPARIVRPVKERSPAPATLKLEGWLLRQLFEFGQRNGYVKTMPLIAPPKDKSRVDRSRPGFTLEEFAHLKKVSEERVAEYAQNSNWQPGKRYKRDDERGRNQRTYLDRVKLHCYCMIAGFTGLRPTELKNLDWGDVQARRFDIKGGAKTDAIVLQVRGKGKSREMVAQPEALSFFNLLRNIFILENDREVKPADPVFTNRDGKRAASYKKGLIELLSAAQLRFNREGRRRDSFSFRHLYITEQIHGGVEAHVLARNTGTSTQMIDRFYSKFVPTSSINRLTPDWLQHRPIDVS